MKAIKIKIMLIGVIMISFLVTFFMVNGYMDSGRKTFKFTNLEVLSNNIKIDELNRFNIYEGISEKNAISYINLKITNEEYFILNRFDEYKIIFDVDFLKTQKNGKNNMFIGFFDPDLSVRNNINFLELIIDENNINALHMGKRKTDLRVKSATIDDQANNIKLIYDINNKDKTIDITLNINNKSQTIHNISIDEEFKNDFDMNNFWFSVTGTDLGIFRINEISVEY